MNIIAEKKPTKEEISRRRKKTISLSKLAEQIRGLRQKLTKDMKSDDEKLRLTATAVAIMDCTAERVGNETSAAEGHVGVTGFKKKNVTVSGNKITLKYVGKSGVDHDKTFTDDRIAKVLRECLSRVKEPNDFVLTTSDGFKIRADRVNRYLAEYDVTAKDIRGYAANHMVLESLKGRVISSEESERKKVMSEVLQKVADAVGHGKATLRKHYLLPNIEDDYVKRGKISIIKKASIEYSSIRVAQSFYIGHITNRVAHQYALVEMFRKLKILVEKYHHQLFGIPSNLPEMIGLRVSDDLKTGKIGSYRYDQGTGYGLLTVGSLAFRRGYRHVYWVMAHELIHAALGEWSDDHGTEFQQFATAFGIPKGYQD